MIGKILISVASIAGINGVLALLLMIAEKFFADYGDCKITINNEDELTVKGGSSLLSSLKDEKIFIPSACGGRGTCGYCKVKITHGAGPLLPTEEPLLEPDEIKNQVRLSCQVKVKKDLKIEIPEELFNIKEFKGRLAVLKDLTHDIKLLRIHLEEPDRIKFKAGQYVQLESRPYGDVKESVSRAYSIASPNHEQDHIDLMIRKVPDGICTTWVHEHLKENDEIKFIGPMGDFYIREGEGEMALIAGGSGMAPMVSLLHFMSEKKIDRKVTYFFGARSLKDLFYLEEMKELEKTVPNFTFIPALSQPAEDDNWEGETGLITDVVDRHIKGRAHETTQGYLCGSPGMIKACRAVLNKNGITNDNIHYDPFA